MHQSYRYRQIFSGVDDDARFLAEWMMTQQSSCWRTVFLGPADAFLGVAWILWDWCKRQTPEATQ